MVEKDFQKFGGEHTEIKLKILDAYVKSYLTGMKNQEWADLLYVDAFAGSGNRQDETLGTTDGSPKRILKQTLTFKHYYFNDANQNYTDALQKMVLNEFSEKKDRVTIECSDANDFILKFINDFKMKLTNRAILFLDPYGMQVKWDTITSIANTSGIDMFCLFPMHALKRQAAKNLHAVSDDKTRKITALLGTDKWLSECYQDNPQNNLFFDDSIRKENRSLEEFVQKRFNDAGFSWVSNPIELVGQKNYHEFSLFFAMTNSSYKAIGLAKKLHTGVVEGL